MTKIQVRLIVLFLFFSASAFGQTDTTALDSSEMDDIEVVDAAEAEAESLLEEAAEETIEAIGDSEVEVVDDEVMEAAEAAAEAILEEAMDEHGEESYSGDPDYNKTYFDEDDTIALYSEGDDGLKLLDKVVGDYTVFISGENHTYTESNARLWLKMVKYLYKNAGVRNVMFEYGHSYGFLVNEYLKTGDTTLFNSINQFAYIEYSNAIKELKEFNDSLPEGQKLYFSAIDIERGVYPIAKILEYLLPDSGAVHDSISLHISSIRSLAAYNDYKLDEQDNATVSYGYNSGFNFKTSATIELIHENFKKFESEYEAYLGNRFADFKEIIYDNYLVRKKWLSYESEGAIQEYIYRENYMHKRFLSEQEKHPGGWFGQFGRCHTTLSKQNSNSCEWFVFNSLADRIENTSGGTFKNKVMSIAILYDLDRKTGPERDSMESQFDKYFADIPENSIVLLDLASDSILHGAYGRDYQFIFLNTNNQKGEVYSYLNDYDLDYDSPFNVKVNGGYSTWNVNMESLNNRLLNDVEGDFFDENLTAWELEFMGQADRTATGIIFGRFNKQDKITSSAKEWNLSGNYFKGVSYYNFTKDAKWIDLLAGMAAGYGRLKLTTKEIADTPGDIDDGQIGNFKYTEYVNPAFLLDFGGIVDINISRITLGYQVGYNLDLSKKKWKTNKETSEFFPETSFSGLFQTLRFGFNLN